MVVALLRQLRPRRRVRRHQRADRDQGELPEEARELERREALAPARRCRCSSGCRSCARRSTVSSTSSRSSRISSNDPTARTCEDGSTRLPDGYRTFTRIRRSTTRRRSAVLAAMSSWECFEGRRSRRRRPRLLRIGPILRPNASESPGGDETMKRKALWALGFTAAAMTFAGVALTAPSNDDELLKDEKHFLEQSNRTCNGGQKAMQILGQPRGRRSRRARRPGLQRRRLGP